MLLAVSALVLAGQAVDFDAGMRPRFTPEQIRRSSEATRDGLAKWAATEFGRRIIQSLDRGEYRIDVEEEEIDDGIGRAPQPGIATLAAAGNHAKQKRYLMILNPNFFTKMPAGMEPLRDQPSSPADVMALAWAGEMLHVWFYARGISLPHHQRLDFQDDWARIASELGMPAVQHDDDAPRRVRTYFSWR